MASAAHGLASTLSSGTLIIGTRETLAGSRRLLSKHRKFASRIRRIVIIRSMGNEG
jgi:hypothetical protein